MLNVPDLFHGRTNDNALMNTDFDDFFLEPFGFSDSFFGRRNPLYGKHTENLMKTDVKEIGNSIQINVDLPGFKKDELSISLNDGYLTIGATKATNNDKTDNDGKIIRQERYSGSLQRTFYVGENVTENDVKAKYENGVLIMTIPKEEDKRAEEKKQIPID